MDCSQFFFFFFLFPTHSSALYTFVSSPSTPLTLRPTQNAIGPLVTELVQPSEGGELTLVAGADLPEFLISFGLREVARDGTVRLVVRAVVSVVFVHGAPPIDCG